MGGDFDKSEESMAEKLKGIADEKNSFETIWEYLLALLKIEAQEGKYRYTVAWGNLGFTKRHIMRAKRHLIESGFTFTNYRGDTLDINWGPSDSSDDEIGFEGLGSLFG
jgi:hypothetical protein